MNIPFFSYPETALRTLARPSTVFYTLAWLMVLLVLGTVSQRYVGLYAAQETFFYSWVLWLGPLPLPGGLPPLIILTLGLIAKLAVATTWNKAQSGIIVTHIGALLLMLGAIITFVQAQDGQITLFEGDQAGYFTAYHDRELVVEDAGTFAVLARYPWKDLRAGHVFKIDDLNVHLEILKICRNCSFIDRTQNKEIPPPDDLKGRARNFDIAPTQSEKEDEVNRSALLFRLSDTHTDKDGIHLTADFIDQSPWFTMNGKTFNIALRKKRYPLPFTVKLHDFKKTVHPGTNTAKSYTSEVIIHDQGGSWAATIRMNEPLRYRGYTFYQSSFLQDGAREGSVLAVVQNTGRIFPYLASFVMACGLLIHILRRRLYRSGISILLLAFLSFMSAPVQAATKLSLSHFAQLPVLDQGRIKPIDTFARSWLEIFSGRGHVQDLQATQWLAELIFTPDIAHDRPVFRIQNGVVRDALGIGTIKDYRYSLNTLLPRIEATQTTWQPLLQADRNKLSLPQKQLLELIENIDSYIEISRSLSVVRPVFNWPGHALDFSISSTHQGNITYLDLFLNQAALKKSVEKLARKAAHENPNRKMAPEEVTLLNIVAQMQETDSHRALLIFRVIPDISNGVWQTPWAAISSPDNRNYLFTWKDLTHAYIKNDQAKFDQNVQKLASLTKEAVPKTSLSAEYLFNQAQLFPISLGLYTAALVLSCLALTFSDHRRLYQFSNLTFVMALLLHLAGLLFRIYLTGRPPVTNLYDSIIFVGLVSTFCAFLFERFTRDGLYLTLGAFAGVALQSIGLKFDTEGDTMRVLMAVLDTNFWLSTHVTMITVGYGFSILTGLLGHSALLVQYFLSSQPERSRQIEKKTLSMAIIALFFTATGTILGGIWADQSWGRFWGWDPKENGALLIVLWIVWALHGQYSRHLHGPILTAVLAALTIIVACAWFGVNLLGVGLHSYGFTESAMAGFAAFCVIDAVLISGLVACIYLKGYRHA